MIKYIFNNKIILRRTKSSSIIKKQMNIPKQIEYKIILKFSSIEKHFYNKLLNDTILSLKEINTERNEKDNILLSRNILQLRASCCHPQVSTSNNNYFGSRITSTTTTNKKRKQKKSNILLSNGISITTGVLSMDQILYKLIDDTKIKCEEYQRIVILHPN